ncbi:MAG: acyltransferase family protein [Acidimicrobiales bacterium]
MTSTAARPPIDPTVATDGEPAGPHDPRGPGTDGGAIHTAGGRARLTYQPALDGLRGLALLFVLLVHAGFTWVPGAFLSVSTFFTLSGFLITSLLIAEHHRHRRIDTRSFWLRRFRRLMPAAIVTLLGVVAFGAFFADATQLARLRGDGIAALLYVANWRFILTNTSYADLFASPSPVQHFWTLSIEEQFYVVFPLVLLGALWLGRQRWRAVAAVVGVITVAAVGWMVLLANRGASVDRLYFSTLTRLPELTIGILLAIAVARWRPAERPRLRLVLELAGMVALVVYVALTLTVHREDAWLYHGGLAAYAAVVSCTLIVAATMPGGLLRPLLALWPLRRLGVLSYTVYLFHWPIYLVLDEERTGLSPWPLFALRMVVTIGAAVVVFRLVETPIRTGARLTGRRAGLAVPAAFSLVILGLVLVTWNPPAPAVNLTGDDQLDPPAVAPGATKVLVVGDSQAWVLGNGMRRFGAAHPDQVAVWNSAVRGCGLVRGGEADRMGTITTDLCDDWEQRFTDALDRFDPDVVVVQSSGWDWVDRRLPDWPDFKKYGDPVFDAHMVDEYRAAADLLTSRGAKVLWMNDACYELEAFSGNDPRHANATIIPKVAEGREDRVEILDQFADLCPGGQFSRTLFGLPDARPDGIHLSDAAADVYAATVVDRARALAGS